MSAPGFRLSGPDGSVLAETFAKVTNSGVYHLSAAFEALGGALRATRVALVEAGQAPDEAPSDPMARALYLRQHRNTGPTVHADPRRNR